MKSFVLCLVSVVLLAMPALAEVSFQFTLPGLRNPDDPNVDGFRLSILHGKAENVTGFDLGIFSLSESAKRSGFGLVFGIAKNTSSSAGLSGAFINLHTGQSSGLNMGFVNSVKTLKDGGANLGMLNITEGFSAVDISGLAISNESNVQVGMVNITEKINHIQIGLLNFAENGFFPVFPLFNYPKK